MPIDPMMIVMLALMALLIFMMFRNGKKRKEMQDQMRQRMVPGAEVMLTSGIYARLEEINEDTNRAVVVAGDATFQVHIQAIAQVVEDDSSVNEAADSQSDSQA